MSARSKRILGLAMIVAVAGVMGVAGFLKILDPKSFLSAILTFQLLTYPVAGVVALWIPWLEVLTAIGLLTVWLRKGSLLLISGMLIVFTVLVIQAWIRGLSIDCGCFGSNELSSSSQYVIKVTQNVGLLALLVCGAVLRRKTVKDQGGEDVSL